MIPGKWNESGQAMVELALLLSLLAIFSLGIVDVSRAVYDSEVLRNLSGEGSNLASRGTSLPNTVTAVVNDSCPSGACDLNLAVSGCVVVSSITCVTNAAGQCTSTYVITGQATSAACHGNTSRVGCYPASPTCNAQATIPTQVQTVLSTVSGYTVYSTEVFYNYSPVTSLGGFLNNNNVLPTQLYSVAYF
ncbi:MAG TPA: TadE/TadG family type IV pilus assembly protein [Candidatus Bathyarchaeia archaeon]|nr:TadE/TadG family type IV pilus assembly protein [Candidatus Bathyarchaeia archaeon]